MSEPVIIEGPCLAVAFREVVKRGEYCTSGLSFCLHGADIYRADSNGDWQELLHFDYNERLWKRVDSGALVERVSIRRLGHIWPVPTAIDVRLSKGEQIIRQATVEGGFSFGKPHPGSPLALKREFFGPDDLLVKEPFAYLTNDEFQWYVQSDESILPWQGKPAYTTGTLVFRTPGRSGFEPVRLDSGKRGRPSGLALGLKRVA